MPKTTMLDEVAVDLSLWIDDTATQIALAMAPRGQQPFAAQMSDKQKLEYYTSRLFNPDGTPNMQGRAQELQRLGAEGFANVYKAVVAAHPNLRPPQRAPIPAPLVPIPPEMGVPPTAPPGMPVRAYAAGGVVTEPTLAILGEGGPEAVVPLQTAASVPTTYTVQPGETLSEIGERFGIPYQQIAQLSGLADPNFVLPGQQLNLGSSMPLAAPLAPTAPAPGGGGAGAGEIEAYIRQAAARRGIDPSTAVAVAAHEGGLEEPAKQGTFSTGRSWWPFQLHYGGEGTPYAAWGDTAGLGNDFTARTGWQPGDPAAWRASVDYALDQVLRVGWYPLFYGSRVAGVSKWQGLPTA
jgi:LysM repeat protein